MLPEGLTSVLSLALFLEGPTSLFLFCSPQCAHLKAGNYKNGGEPVIPVWPPKDKAPLPQSNNSSSSSSHPWVLPSAIYCSSWSFLL